MLQELWPHVCGFFISREFVLVRTDSLQLNMLSSQRGWLGQTLSPPIVLLRGDQLAHCTAEIA